MEECAANETCGCLLGCYDSPDVLECSLGCGFDPEIPEVAGLLECVEGPCVEVCQSLP